MKDNIYQDIPTKFIDDKRFTMSITYRIRISMWLRLQNYHTAICFMHHRLEMRDDALVLASAADEKLVAELPFLELRWYPWLFEYYLKRMTRVIPAIGPISTPLPHVDVHCKYARKVPHAFERFRAFCHHLYPDVDLEVKPLMAPPGCSFLSDELSDPIVVLNPGAKHEARIWPLREWVRLAYQIANRGFTVCFTGGPAEERLVDQLHDLIETNDTITGAKARIAVLINKLSFRSLIALFERAQCYIGPDTGTSHLAYWLGTPTITLLLHTDGTEEADRFGDFFPYPEHFLQTPYRCVCATKQTFHVRDGAEGIRPQVWAAFADLAQLGGRPK